MPLESKKVPVVFDGGVDNKTASELVVPGKFASLQNVWSSKLARFKKRFGYTSLGDPVSGTTGETVHGLITAKNKQELRELNTEGVCVYAPTAGTWGNLANTGTSQFKYVKGQIKYRDASVAFTPSVLGFKNYLGYQVAINGSYELSMWHDGDLKIRYAMRDITTDTVVFTGSSSYVLASSSQATTMFAGIVTSVPDWFSWCVINTGGTAIDLYRIQISQVIGTMASGISSAASFSATAVSQARFMNLNSTHGALVFQVDPSGTDTMHVRTINVTGGSATASTSYTSARTLREAAVDETNQRIYIISNSGAGNDSLKCYSSDLTSASTLTTLGVVRDWRIVIETALTNNVHFFMNDSTNYILYYGTGQRWDGTNGSSAPIPGFTNTLVTQRIVFESAAFFGGRGAHVLVRPNTGPNINYAYYLISTLPNASSGSSYGGAVSAKYFEGRAYNNDSGKYYKVSMSGGTAYLGVTYFSKINVISVAGVQEGLPGAAVLVADTAPTTVSYADTDRGTYIAGGIVWYTRDTEVHESNFLWAPHITTTTAADGSAGLNGTYGIVAVYEYTDSAGQIHRSAPSFSASQAVTAGNKIVVTIPRLGLTNKTRDLVDVVLYITEAGGTIYYYHSAKSNSTASAGFVTIDVQLNPDPAARVLYTTGDVVENIQPECTNYIKQINNRLFVTCDSDVFYGFTKEKVSDEPYSFAFTVFQDATELNGGNAVGLAEMDGKIVFFQSGGMKYIVGEGPADTGINNDWLTPKNVPTNVGCISGPSIVEFDRGVMFQATGGKLYLLDRSFSVTYAGNPVDDFTDTITSSVLIPTKEEIRWGSLTNNCLVFNYVQNRWYTSSNMLMKGAVLYRGSYVYLSSTDLRLLESGSVYTDNGTNIQMTIETGWLALDTLLGYQRIYEIELLGQSLSTHTLQVEIAYDYETAYSQTLTFASSNIVAGSPLNYRIRPAKQKCTAIKLRIRDTSASGAAFDIVGMAVEVGIKRDLRGLRSEQSK